MIGRYLLAGMAALLLAACGEAPPPPPSADNPLLWEVANADGEVEGWLYGTIHALPDGVSWRSAAVSDVVEAADFLVVEIADLENSVAIGQAFTKASRSAGHPPLAARVAPDKQQIISKLVADTPYSASDYRQIETWAAALILAQAIRTGVDSDNGVDKALIREFSGRDIVELEGAVRQFAIFDGLAEADQRVMLETVVKQAEQQENPLRAADLWLAGDAKALAEETGKGMLADPEVRDALLTQRNLAWVNRAGTLFEDTKRPLIAVGAAHLVGSDGLVALLEAEGYTLSRLR